jgi:hypothetical protein
MQRLPRTVLTVIAIGILGFWYWYRLDALSDLGGFESARQEGRERRARERENQLQAPATVASDSNREALDSDAGDAGVNGKASDAAEGGEADAPSSWWEDPDTLARFHAEYLRQVPTAIADAAQMRAENSAMVQRDRDALAETMTAMYEAGVPTAILAEHEMQGLEYDMIAPGASMLKSNLSQCANWLMQGAGLNEVPKIDVLARMPEDHPVEFILSRMTGRSITELDPSLAPSIASLRNEFVREFSVLGGQTWELRPAAYRAVQALVLPDDRKSSLLIPPFAEFVPELAQIETQQQALRERYLAQLEIYAAQLR